MHVVLYHVKNLLTNDYFSVVIMEWKMSTKYKMRILSDDQTDQKRNPLDPE